MVGARDEGGSYLSPQQAGRKERQEKSKALGSLDCQLVPAQGHLRGDSSNEEFPRTDWPTGISVEDCLDY